MEDEAIAALSGEAVDDLLILLRAKRREGERLRFAAGEERGTVGARKDAHADFDRTHRAGVAAVNTGLAAENTVTHKVRFHFKQNAVHFVLIERGFGAGGLSVLLQRLMHEFVHGADLLGTGLLLADIVGGLETVESEFADTGNESLVLRGRLPIPGGLAGFFNEAVDRFDRDLHLLVAKAHSAEHHIFRQTVGFRLHHQHGAGRTGNDEVELGIRHLGDVRVADILAVDVTNAAAGDRALEGDAGNLQSGGSAEHGGDVRIHFGVSGHDRADHLHFVIEAIREKRADRAVDEARGQRLVFRRTAFTLEEAAGETAGRVSLLNIVNGEREEVLAFLRFLLRDNSGEHHGVAHLHDAGAGGLAGHFTGRERNVVVAETESPGDLIEHCHIDCIP